MENENETTTLRLQPNDSYDLSVYSLSIQSSSLLVHNLFVSDNHNWNE